VHHDRLTIAVYAVPALWGWILYSFSPSVPLLRDEQGTSRAVAGLHGTAIAVGSILAAAVSVAIVRRIGRRGVLVTGSALAAFGVVLLVAAPGVVWTVSAAFVVGAGGAMAFNAVSPVLSSHHDQAGAAAISEANGVAAALGIFGPVAVGVSVALGLSWRGAVALAVPIAVLAVMLVLRAPAVPALDADPRPAAGARDPLPRRFWVALGVVTCTVAVEFCLTYWAGDLLRQQTGVSASTAAALISVVIGGMAIGRFSAGWFTGRVGVEPLLLAAIGLAVAGWLILWLATSVAVAAVGLLVVGLGVSVQFPMALARLLRASAGRSDEAAGWATLGAGVASGCAPFALGAISDAVGPHRGFLLVPALLLAAAVGVVLAPARRRLSLRAG
jgi:MFS family permease